MMDAKEWNDRYLVRQEVFLLEDDGSVTMTQTRSIAWELEHGESVIKVVDKTGGYLLSKITARV